MGSVLGYLIAGIMIALSQLGISLGPLLAGLGVLGFIIGFALQDTLSNFASDAPQQGASTITMQVVKNDFLAGLERAVGVDAELLPGNCS